MGHFARECRANTKINLMDAYEEEMEMLPKPMEPKIDRIARLKAKIDSLSKEGNDQLIENLGNSGFQGA
jgi:hypothetical protein